MAWHAYRIQPEYFLAKALWPKHSAAVYQDGLLVHGSNKCRGNSETHVHLQFSNRNSSPVQTIGVLSYQSTWEQPSLYLGAVTGTGMGDKASVWGCLPAATLAKGLSCRGMAVAPAAPGQMCSASCGTLLGDHNITCCHCTPSLHGAWQPESKPEPKEVFGSSSACCGLDYTRQTDEFPTWCWSQTILQFGKKFDCTA